MEPALRAVCKDVRIGTILIQTNSNTGEPEVKGLVLRVEGALRPVTIRSSRVSVAGIPSAATCLVIAISSFVPAGHSRSRQQVAGW